MTIEEEIQLLEDEISKEESLIQAKRKRLDTLIDEVESSKLPEYSRHECIECHKHRASRGVYHNGKLTGYICGSCDYEIL